MSIGEGVHKARPYINLSQSAFVSIRVLSDVVSLGTWANKSSSGFRVSRSGVAAISFALIRAIRGQPNSGLGQPQMNADGHG